MLDESVGKDIVVAHETERCRHSVSWRTSTVRELAGGVVGVLGLGVLARELEGKAGDEVLYHDSSLSLQFYLSLIAVDLS
jgi:phosphoglycerate dehydrogenase-like enzyme